MDHVSGPSRGWLFNLDLQSAMNVTSRKVCGRFLELRQQRCPIHFVKDANFLDWYERWLDQALAGEPAGWFGYDNPDHPDTGR